MKLSRSYRTPDQNHTPLPESHFYIAKVRQDVGIYNSPCLHASAEHNEGTEADNPEVAQTNGVSPLQQTQAANSTPDPRLQASEI